jgi:hypothetical protein
LNPAKIESTIAIDGSVMYLGLNSIRHLGFKYLVATSEQVGGPVMGDHDGHALGRKL